MSVICARISGVLRSSCILLGGEINHEEHEGHGEFRFVLRTAGRLRSGERELLARSARQLAEHKIPSASCQRLQAGSLRSPGTRTRDDRTFSRKRSMLFSLVRFLLLASALVCASCGRADTQVAD